MLADSVVTRSKRLFAIGLGLGYQLGYVYGPNELYLSLMTSRFNRNPFAFVSCSAFNPSVGEVD